MNHGQMAIIKCKFRRVSQKLRFVVNINCGKQNKCKFQTPEKNMNTRMLHCLLIQTCNI